MFTETQKKMFTHNGDIKRYINGNIVDKFNAGDCADISFPNGYNKGKRVFSGYAPTLACHTIKSLVIKERKMKELRIRKLTPKECFRLMGFDDRDEEVLTENGISNSQQYKMAGNSIVVNVLEAIFEILLKGKEDNINVLSLFSGIGAFEKAIERQNINYKLINYCEIDKFASRAYSLIHNVSQDKNLGDITKIDISALPKDIDLICHGSPCQDFSISGLGKGGEKGSGTRSSLMWNTVDIVTEVKPKYVIWENVKNLLSKKHRHNFDGYLKIMEELGYNNYWSVLNATDYGIPQNRERVFTISIRQDIDKNDFYFPLPRPLDKVLDDLLEDEVDEKYYLSKKMISYISAKGTKEFNNNNSESNLDIARPLTTDQNKRAGTTNYIGEELPKNYDLAKVNRIGGIFDTENKQHQAGSIYDGDGLAPNLDTMQGGYRQPCVLEKQKKNQQAVIVENRGEVIKRPTDIASTLLARDYKGLGNQQATAVLVYGNKRLNETLDKYEEIKENSYIDTYNKTIKSHIAGTITEGVDYRNHTFIAVKEKTTKGYAIARVGDGIYINRSHQKRGVV